MATFYKQKTEIRVATDITINKTIPPITLLSSTVVFLNQIATFYKQKTEIRVVTNITANSKQQILMYAMLLSPLGLFHEFFRFIFVFSALNIRLMTQLEQHGQPRRPASVLARSFPQASVLSFRI
jgi:uncharacterized membrane protein YbhN (UPF0104 family)